MSYCQYKIHCSNCMSESFIVCEECNPIIYKCRGCNRVVVIHNDQAYTVTENFFKKMVKKYNMKYCGQIVKCFPGNIANQYKKIIKKENISEEDLSKLHDFLIKSEDSSDIIEEL
jgi:hypothetical protein